MEAEHFESNETSNMIERGHFFSYELPHLESPENDIGCKTDGVDRETTELPHLADLENGMGWKLENSGRETTELPHLVEDAEKQEASEYYSTYAERVQQTPREDSNRGEWSGERGESEFTPNDEEVQEILDRYDQDNILYEDAIPDFSEVAESTVEIENMTENRADNFRQCDEECAGQWNEEERDGRTDWTAREVKEWRQENGYSWHERNDMKTCDLVPTKVNDYFGHLGGVSECRKRDAENGGSDFDE